MPCTAQRLNFSRGLDSNNLSDRHAKIRSALSRLAPPSRPSLAICPAASHYNAGSVHLRSLAQSRRRRLHSRFQRPSLPFGPSLLSPPIASSPPVPSPRTLESLRDKHQVPALGAHCDRHCNRLTVLCEPRRASRRRHAVSQGWTELEVCKGADTSNQGAIERRDANTIYTAGWCYGNHPVTMARPVSFGVGHAEVGGYALACWLLVCSH